MALAGSDEILTPVTAMPGEGSVAASAAKGVVALCGFCSPRRKRVRLFGTVW